MAFFGSAFGILAAGTDLVAGLVVFDAISRMAKCTQCGYKDPDVNVVKRHARKHVVKQIASQRTAPPRYRDKNQEEMAKIYENLWGKGPTGWG